MHAPPHNKSLKRRFGESDSARQPQACRDPKKTSSKWRTKRAADEIPPLHPHALYRPGRLCVLFDIDKSTLTRWVKKKLLPPYTVVGGIKGLTGEQLQKFLAQREEGGKMTTPPDPADFFHKAEQVRALAKVGKNDAASSGAKIAADSNVGPVS